MVIEAGDYNYNGGSYINRPVPSGFKESGQSVNSGDQAYLDREGIPDVDFFDYSDTAGEEALPFTGPGIQSTRRRNPPKQPMSPTDGEPAVNDTTRKASLDVGCPNIIHRDRGGEWLNYTREFPNGEYHVYLRAIQSHPIHLSGPGQRQHSGTNQSTERLGTFQMPNMGIKSNYRFVALTGEGGSRVKLNLNGKTMRLSIGTEDDNRVNNTSLNYLLLCQPPRKATTEETLSIAGAATVSGDYNEVTGLFLNPVRSPCHGSPCSFSRFWCQQRRRQALSTPSRFRGMP